MKRKFVLFLLLVVYEVSLTGCWNYREINRLSIVSGLAVDKASDGSYLLSVEIVNIEEGGREVKIKPKILETKGKTIQDAIRNALKITSPRLYFGHMETVVISETVAREGIYDIVDFLSRDIEPRMNIDLLVSAEKTAGAILHSQSVTTQIRSYELDRMLRDQKDASKILRVQVYEFINNMAGEGISPVLPCVKGIANEGMETSELSETAIFKGDKLLGFTGDEETKYILYVQDKVKGGLLDLENVANIRDAKTSLDIFSSKTKIQPVYENGKFKMIINTDTKTRINEQATNFNFTSTEGIALLEKEAGKQLETGIKNTIRELQKDYNSDIFGFGATIKRNMPDLWKKVEKDWPTLYKDLEVSVHSTVRIKNTGLISKPAKLKD